MKKVSLLLILIFTITAVSAQESGVSSQAGRKTTFAKNGFWDNWFVGVGAGGNVYFGDFDAQAKFKSRPTLSYHAQVGKWISPVWGGRLKAEGGRMHTFLPKAGGNGNDMLKNNYVNTHVDLLLNVSNYLGKYNENRFYSFIPYVGIGFMYTWNYKNYPTFGLADHDGKSATINAGIINNFRLSNRLSLAIEISSTLVKDDIDRRTLNKYSYDAMGGVSGSLVYKVGKVGFSEAVLLDQGLVDDLNAQINGLRQENAKLAQRPANCPKCPDVQTVTKEVVKGNGLTNVVFFRLNSSTVDKHQEINIFNTAKYLQDNPNAKVKIVGYADKNTGTASINDKLSEKRAKNVADQLINKYKINSNRVTVEWKGSTQQPYSNNEWNRVAIAIAD